MRLRDALPDWSDRFAVAEDPEAWSQVVLEARHCRWLAWNLRHDEWFTPDDARLLQAALQTILAAAPDLCGAELLCQLAGELERSGVRSRLRPLTEDEYRRVPQRVVTHVVGETSFRGRYNVVGEHSLFGERALPREPTSFSVVPKPAHHRHVWVTFDDSPRLPPDADETARELGLAAHTATPTKLYRIRSHGFEAARIPTLFDGISYRPVSADWRAHPATERASDCCWGITRDLLTSRGIRPEIVVRLPQKRLEYEDLGTLNGTYSHRPYLDEAL